MRTIRFLLQKEFRQIFRNKSILALIIVMPTMQLLLLPLAADYEIKNINLAVVDHDHSAYSERLINKVVASGYFKLTGYTASFNEALDLVESDETDLILEVPPGFEKNLVREGEQNLFLAVNAINGVKANMGAAYVGTIIRNFNNDVRIQLLPAISTNLSEGIEVASVNRFNLFMSYHFFMVPGILAILVTMVGGFLTALNIVKEKEVGTMEQINVTPIKKHHFIIGKLIPFWVLGNVVFTVGLIVSFVDYGIIPAGHFYVLYIFLWVYLVAVLGFGLLVSTYCETQQQAMFIMFFFMMVFILLGGLFTSIDSMPAWAQTVAAFNPISYLIEVSRMVILKGSSLQDILPQLGKMTIFAIVLNILAVLKYQKTS